MTTPLRQSVKAFTYRVKNARRDSIGHFAVALMQIAMADERARMIPFADSNRTMAARSVPLCTYSYWMPIRSS